MLLVVRAGKGDHRGLLLVANRADLLLAVSVDQVGELPSQDFVVQLLYFDTTESRIALIFKVLVHLVLWSCQVVLGGHKVFVVKLALDHCHLALPCSDPRLRLHAFIFVDLEQ